MRHIDKIILHCSATKEGIEFDVEDIKLWHLKRGFNDVGYHYYIRKDGTIQKGRAWETQGAHCRGHNKHSLGICLGGRHKFTPRQFEALESLLERLWDEFTYLPVKGHYEYSSKTCPNFDINLLE